MKRILFILIIIVVFYSCESYVDNFKILKHPPKTVVNAIFNNSDTLWVYISQSMSIDEIGNSNTSVVKTSTIKVFENNKELTNIINKNNGEYFVNGLISVPGTTYSLEAQANNNPLTKASIIIPPKPSFSINDIKLITNVNSPNCTGCDNDYIEFNLSIENFDQKAYYAFELLQNSYEIRECLRDTVIIGVTQEYVECLEYDSILSFNRINFTTKSSLIDFYFDGYDYWTASESDETEYLKIFFTNSNVKGEQIEMKVRISHYFANAFDRLKVVLHTYDYEYYKHMKSYTLYHENSYDFLAEKVKVYSNIADGLGIFAAEFTDTITFDINQFAYNYSNTNSLY